MKLTDLNATIETHKVLVCDCPCGGKHKLRLPLGAEKHEWTATGEIKNLTLRPSVLSECWEGIIKNGEVLTCSK